MNERHKQLVDARVSVRGVIAALWTSVLFVFAYVDIFGFWRADVVNGALAGRVPGSEFVIDQRFLLLTTVYVVVPAVMIAATVLASARLVRGLNIVVAVAYLASVVASVVGEHWAYYVLGSVVECLLLAAIAMTAWRWPRRTHHATEQRGGPGVVSPSVVASATSIEEGRDVAAPGEAEVLAGKGW